MLEKIQYKNKVAFIFILAVFLDLADTFIVNVAFPSMAQQLHVSLSQLGWVIHVYMLSIALTVPASAALGERFGTKKIFLISLFVFTTSSLFCALANSFFVLLLFRALQGIGAGLCVTVGQNMFFQAFPKNELLKIMSLIYMPMLLAPALSQLLGGMLVQWLSWRWIFYINIPVGILCFYFSQKFLKESSVMEGVFFDKKGFILSAFGFVTLFYGLSRFEMSQTFLIPLFFVLIGTLILIYFSKIMLNKIHPFLNLRVYRNYYYRWSMLSYVIVMIANMGSYMIYNFFLQGTFGLSVFETGLLSLPFCLGMLFTTGFLNRLCTRFGTTKMYQLGIFCCILSCFGFFFIHSRSQILWIGFIYFLRGFGQGFLSLILQTSSLRTMNKSLLDHASTIICVNWYLAVSLGVTFFTVFVTLRMQWFQIIPVRFFVENQLSHIVQIFREVNAVTAFLYFLSLMLFLKMKIKKEEEKLEWNQSPVS